MNKLLLFAVHGVLLALLLLVCPPNGLADGSTGGPEKPLDKGTDQPDLPAGAVPSTGTTPASPSAAKLPGGKPKYPPFAELLEDAEAIEGLIKLYRKDTKLYAELTPAQMNRDLIVIISIARGIGRGRLLGGMSWGFGDDWIWQFRRADDRIQIVRRNVRFRAAKGTPQEKAVQLAYTDSVLFSLPIATFSPAGAAVVDLTGVFMSDLPQISSTLRGFSFAADRSTWASVKAFKENIEIQVAATYASSGAESLETVADSRGVTINIHYSISRLPETGYEPRPADDRVGYFLTVVKDFTKATDHDRFVRYINRWDLRKADAGADPSPPKQPIIFWLEKTIPFKYRAPIREGILEWNKAFERAGFVNAIEVRQQPAESDWDPEDIGYNTFRWITSSAGLAMGPSRVNPTTGQILDADIIFDADFLQYWKDRYEAVATQDRPGGEGGLLEAWSYAPAAPGLRHPAHRCGYRCQCAEGMARQLAFAAVVLAPAERPISKELMEQLIMEGIRSVATHEVGHTLGLRHNFKASAFLSLEEMADPAKTAKVGIAASVMDYLPMNIAPKGQKQGPYFDTVLGPYDYWAIEYGYKPLGGGSEGEQAALQKIAARCAEPALQYGTDEDTEADDPDPLCTRYDLGDDPVKFAQRRVQLIQQALPDLLERTVADGEGYQQARRAFNILLADYGTGMQCVARLVGGMYVHRHHKGDPNARPPFEVVQANRQRAAMDLLQSQLFGEEALQFPPKLYNYLAPSFWHHWGAEPLPRADYPLHETMLNRQERVLGHLLSAATLSRLLDCEAKVPAPEDAFTAAELLGRLSAAIFAETAKLPAGEFTNRKPAINSLRRNLQRRYVERLADLALGDEPAPSDVQNVAAAELAALQGQLKQALAGGAKLDPYTGAHLSETAGFIGKVLDARVQLPRPKGGALPSRPQRVF